MQPPIDLLACPRCRGVLEERGQGFACAACGAGYEERDGVVRLRIRSDERTETVRQFYSQSPFPGYPPRDSLDGLRARAERSEFARLLDRAVPGDARIVEVGCGTGQMSLFLATADRVVVGADITAASLACAARAQARFGVERVLFVETDLRAPGLREAAFDVVYSSGVLHHTPDPRASFAALARLARPGGIIVLGLYNFLARLPHRFRRALARLTGFRRVWFDPILGDRESEPDRREAWLRDQYLHPEEHRHSVGEVEGWFRENGIDFLRTYPSALIGDEPLSGEELFSPACDNWWLESLLSQAAWATTLAREGGLFVTIGRRRPF
jgi:SAM-dependent methyltransferase